MSNIIITNDQLVLNKEILETKDGYLFSSKNKQKEFQIKITNSNEEPFNLVIDENSDIKITVELLSDFDEKQINKINLKVLKNSSLTFLLITETNQDESLLELSFDLEKDASADILTNYLAENVVVTQKVNLLGENSNVNLKSVVLSSLNNSQVINTNITHKAKNSIAEMTKIGIVNNNGKVILNGVAKIEKSFDKSSSFQNLKGITTSDSAYIEVNPILLIDEYDVKAGHGATVGKVEDEVLYYLMSRGLTKAEAERLVLLGFLNPVLLEIKDEDIRDRFLKLVEKRL